MVLQHSTFSIDLGGVGQLFETQILVPVPGVVVQSATKLDSSFRFPNRLEL